MKKFIIPCLAVAALLTVPACTTVEEKPSTHTTTTSTEESTVRHPVSATSTTETRSVRSY